MRTTDKEEAPQLGKKIEPPPAPQPHKRVADGVWRSPDGKLYTHIPKNESAR